MSNALALFTHEVDRALMDKSDQSDEAIVLDRVCKAMAQLVDRDDWLPDAYAQPHPQFYQQYLLYCDPDKRFSVVSFVWGPGQKTPIHDHMVWGVIGMLRGSEYGQSFQQGPEGLLPYGEIEQLQPGDVTAVSPSIGDIHQVSNAYDDRVSISIHVYGADIGQQKRHVFDPVTGAQKEFISGYANAAEVSQ